MYDDHDPTPRQKRKAPWFMRVSTWIMGIVAVVGVSTVLSNVFTVDEGERYVITHLGVYEEVKEPGLRIKLPFIQEKYKFIVRTQAGTVEDMTALTSDNQVITADLLVPYKLQASELSRIYIQYGHGFEGELMTRLTTSAFREYLGDVNTITIAQDRDKIGVEIGKQLVKLLEPYGVEVQAGDVKLADIKFSAAFQARISQALEEKAMVEKARQNARRKEQEAFAAVAQAKGISDSKKLQADAEAYQVFEVAKANAESIKMKGDAEAHRLRERTKAIRENPQLINLLQAEAQLRWDGKLPTSMIPGSVLPIMNLNKPE